VIIWSASWSVSKRASGSELGGSTWSPGSFSSRPNLVGVAVPRLTEGAWPSLGLGKIGDSGRRMPSYGAFRPRW